MVFLIIILQILWWQSAKKDAKEEVAWSFPFRTFDWGVLQPKKNYYSREAHRYGAQSVGILLIITSFGYAGSLYSYHALWQVAIDFILSFLSCGLVYWKYFDMAYAKEIGMDRFYLGGTAFLDKMLKKRFGEKAGRKKALFCSVGIAVADAILITLYYIL